MDISHDNSIIWPTFRNLGDNFLTKCKKMSNVFFALNKKLVKVGHMGIKGGSSFVNHLVRVLNSNPWWHRWNLKGFLIFLVFDRNIEGNVQAGSILVSYAGMEITKKKKKIHLSCGKWQEKLPVQRYFCLPWLPDKWNRVEYISKTSASPLENCLKYLLVHHYFYLSWTGR